MIQLFKPRRLPAVVSVGLLFLRVLVGLAFMFHGHAKIQHPASWMGPNATIPAFFQVLAAISEFCGGLAWILGVLTPLASFGVACTMAVAVWMTTTVFHLPFVSQKGGGAVELPATYLCVALLLLLAGPGRFSLDRILFGERGPATPGPAEQKSPAG